MNYLIIDRCRVCGSKKSEYMYESYFGGSDDKDRHIDRKVDVVKCCECGFIYSTEVMTKEAATDFWNSYSGNVHQVNNESNIKRLKMYELEYDFISDYYSDTNVKKVLDVGCANGGFLGHFLKNGWECYGTEIDKENVSFIDKRIKVYLDELTNADFEGTRFDLIIFRGTALYFNSPKEYFEKAISLLNKGGLIFITSTPDQNAYCYKLFKGKANIPVCGIAQNGFTKEFLIRLFKEKGYSLFGDKCFYEDTPYADIENDVNKVQKALEYTKKGKEIDFSCPAFWGNMMSLVFGER